MVSNFEATERFLNGLPADIAASPLAAAALSLAAGMDDPHNSFTSRALATKEFRELMRELRDLAPTEEVKDELDDLVEGRRLRLVGGAATAN